MASSPEGKTALVTGASRGIGRATALALAEAGARILVHYGKSVSDAESLVTDIRSKRGRAVPFNRTWELQKAQPCWRRR